MSNFTIYPAIDLRQGRVVRLSQGDPNREKSYANQPLSVAKQWQEAGAMWLHVVNLDGAFGEKGLLNIQALADITATGMHVQFGGGLRTMEAIHHTLELGVTRVVLGTIAVHNPTLVEKALIEFGPDCIALGIDARDGVVRVRGWKEATPLQAMQLALQWQEMGGKWLIFTDITRDGMGSGVNVDATATLANVTGLHVIASGGVGSLQNVESVKKAGLSGVIIGRALYEGHVNLAEALALTNV